MVPLATAKTASRIILFVGTLVLGLMIGSCVRSVDSEGYVRIEPVDDPTSLPYEFQDIQHSPFINSDQNPIRGQIVFYDSVPAGSPAMCRIADSWNATDSMSALVFYADLERRKTLSHINIRTNRIDDAIVVDYDQDGRPDIATVYKCHDSVFVHFLNETDRQLSKTLLLVGKDLNENGYWDGFARLLGSYDLNQDGRARELLISIDVGYDLYPRELMCYDLDADSILWIFPYAGAMNHEHFCVQPLEPGAPPSIVFGLASKGNAAVTDLMDDGHSYIVVLDDQGRLSWLKEVGAAFQSALPVLFDCNGDGSLEILSPRRLGNSAGEPEGSVIDVYDVKGHLLDSLAMTGTGYVTSIMTANLFGDQDLEVVLAMTDGRIIVLNADLQFIRKSRFYSSVRLWGIDDYIAGSGLEIAVSTRDNRLWILNANLWAMAVLRDVAKPRLSRQHLVHAPDTQQGLFFVSADGDRTFITYTFTRTSWTRIFSRQPSLAFWLAFVPMALVVAVIIGLWRRTRLQYKTIVQQKDQLDRTLHELREARKELVAADEFKKARRALLASEQRFRELADLLPQTVFETDLEGRVTYTNRRGLEITGYTLADIEDGLYLHDVIEPIDDRTIDEILRARIDGTAPDATEYLMIRKDGRKYPAMSYASLIIRDGQPVGIRGISVDMTERKATERALVESEERYRNLVESAGDPIFTTDRDGRFLFMNSVAAERLGSTTDELVGKTMAEIFPEGAAESQLQSIRTVFDSGRGGTFETVTYLKGQPVHYRTSLEPVRNASGEVVAVLGIARDISTLMEMTQALKMERDFIGSLLATANSAIVCFDDDLNITEFNNECERLLGIERSVAIGQTWIDLPYANECGASREDFVSWILDGKRPRWEGALCTVDDVELTMLWSKSVLSVAGSGDRTITIAVGQDITELKQVESALASSEDRYRRIWEASRQAMSLTDENGILRFVNPAYCDLFKYTEEELLGHYFADLVMTEDALEDWAERYQEVFDSKEPFSLNDYVLRDKHGNRLYVEITSAKITLQDGGEFMVTMLTDVTDRNQAQRALRESEERYRRIWEASGQAISLTDENGILRFVNPAYCRLFKYTEEELLGQYFGDMVLPEDALEYMEVRYREIFDSKKPFATDDYVLRDKYGDVLYLEISVANITLRDGGEFLVTMLTDVTERHRAQQALRESEERFRTIAEVSAVAIIITRPEDGKVYYVNRACCELFGYTAEEMLDLKSTALYDKPEDRLIVMDRLHSGRQVHNIEVIARRKDGSRFWGLLTVRSLTLDGKPGLMGSLIDISERKEMEEALRESEERFRTIAEATPIPVAITRLSDAEIIYANPSMGPTFGYDQDEMIGLKSVVLYKDPQDRENIKEILSRDGRVDNYELMGVRKDGSEFWALLTLQTIRFRGELAVFGGFIDVTERKQTRLRLEQAAQEQYDQVKRVAGSLAHEIYNALFPATSSLDKLQERIGLTGDDDLERNQRLLELSEKAVQRAIDMTGLVKQYSRLETERKYESVSLRKIMTEVTRANVEALTEADITVENQLPEDLQIRMYGVHAYSLLNNLTTNAIAALRGRPVRTIRVALEEHTDQEVKVVFSDTGPGIPASARESVFKAFYSTNPNSGTGLGLAMVMRIAELYGGSVSLEERVDNGAVFVILLPLNGNN